MIFSVILVLLAQLISASKPPGKESASVVYSSNINTGVGNMKIEVLDLSKPVLHPDGKYDEYVIETATEIVFQYLENRAVEMYTTNPSTVSFFSFAFEDVHMTMHVDLRYVVPAVLRELLKKFANYVHHFNHPILPVWPGTKEFKEREKTAKMVTILVQECVSNNVAFEQSQIPSLLEFIYRFGTNGARYGLAFQGLYVSLSPDNFHPAYTMILKYFDPKRHALPVFYIQSVTEESQIKEVFTDFLTKLAGKILQIDHEDDLDDYNRHACMCIASMISCNFVEEFFPLLSRLLFNVDIVLLGSSPRFARSAIALSEALKDQNTVLLDMFCSRLIESEVLLALQKSNFVDHGSIIVNIKANQPFLYEKYKQLLSPLALERLEEVEEVYDTYRLTMGYCVVFKKLDETLLGMDLNMLETMQLTLSKIIRFFPDFHVHHSAEASVVNKDLVLIIPKVVNALMRDSDRSLDIQRFMVLVLLLEVIFISPAIVDITAEAFSTVLFFYNLRLADSDPADPAIQAAHVTCVKLLEKLLNSDHFFAFIKQRSVLYNYFKLINPETAEEAMFGCFSVMLANSGQKYMAFLDIASTATKLKLGAGPVFSTFIAHEVEKYITHFKSVPIEIYQKGTFVSLIMALIDGKWLSKSEIILLKSICNRFSSTHNIFK